MPFREVPRLRHRLTLYQAEAGGGAVVDNSVDGNRTWERVGYQAVPAGLQHYGWTAPQGEAVAVFDWRALAVAVADDPAPADAYAVVIGALSVFVARTADNLPMLAVNTSERPEVSARLLTEPSAVWAALLATDQPEAPDSLFGQMRAPPLRRRWLIRRRGRLPVPATSLQEAGRPRYVWDGERLGRIERAAAAPEYNENEYAYIEAE